MITSLDHLVLFYVDGLGMRLVTFDQGRKALHFGSHKINLHLAGHEFEPNAAHPVPGSGDLCFLTERPLAEIGERLASLGHPVMLGPVARVGATGPIRSIYAPDPDGNLVEIARRE
jgi:catechol 2,3-dioxygenase-like lactoylglutathione lyase family enzyme